VCSVSKDRTAGVARMTVANATRPDDAGEELLRIGEVARLVGVSASTLRSWEREGLAHPMRGTGRQRRYTRDDVARLRETRALLDSGYGRRVLRRVLASDPAPNEGGMGPRLRALRLRRGLSLRKAAATAGVSISSLSQLERGVVPPTVSLLQRVATAYGGTLLEFFDHTEHGRHDTGGSHALVRAGERRTLRGFDHVLMEDLVRVPDAVLQVEIFTIQPGGGSGGGYAHEGEEALFVMEGQLQVWLDEEEHYDLVAGDTLYFRSARVHRWHNPGVGPARIFWVNTPPTF